MVLVVALVGTAVSAQGPWFPFAMTEVGARPGPISLAAWNRTPAGRHGPIAARDGHFVDGAGKRIRFFGTNLCFSGCFPAHNVAERLAARLAALGINLVRLHHMDTSYFPRGIWDPKDRTRHTLSQEALDRLDYLIAQLIRHGIYVNVNLHVGRSPHESDPAPQAKKLPRYGKGVGNFWPPLIELQKWYARQIMGRVNKYTGRRYADEPGIAFVEISNEDSLTMVWLRWKEIDSLPRPYAAYLDEQWNEWLRRRYGTTAKLRAAWSQGEVALGEELALNGDFHAGREGWTAQAVDPCKMAAELTQEGPDGKPALKVTVTATDPVSWHGQVYYRTVEVKAGEPYRLAVWLRAEPERTVNVNVMRARAPWGWLGMSAKVAVGRQWRRYEFSFRGSENETQARVTISSLAAAKGTVWIGGLSLRPGGIVGLPEGEGLEKGNVSRIPATGLAGRTRAAASDQCLFYMDLERRYWQTMYDELKKNLGVKALVTGTQITYSPPYTQQMMDYVDVHAYWHHPSFPGRPWDRRNWYIVNESMVGRPPGTMGRLIAHRIAGKPYTVSEYNHPVPNQYGSECFIFLSAFGAFQDWDAVYGFTFSNSDEYQVDRLEGYFNLRSDPVKLVTFPFAAAVMRRGDIAAGREVLAPAGNLKRAVEAMLSGSTSLSAGHLGVAAEDMLRHRVALKWGGKSEGAAGKPQSEVGRKRLVSDNGQLVWDVSKAGQEVFMVRAARAKALVGACCGRQYDLGDGVEVAVADNSLHWAAITMTQLRGERIGGRGELLITATGAYRNPGWGWQELGRGRATLGPNWGKGPVEVEGIEAWGRIAAADRRARAWALDEHGQKRQPVELVRRDGRMELHLQPAYRTLWYYVAVGP